MQLSGIEVTQDDGSIYIMPSNLRLEYADHSIDSSSQEVSLSPSTPLFSIYPSLLYLPPSSPSTPLTIISLVVYHSPPHPLYLLPLYRLPFYPLPLSL